MESLSGQLAEDTAVEVFRDLGRDRRTGVLDLLDGAAGRAERYFFVSGELYLAPDDPLSGTVATLAGKGPVASARQDRGRDRGEEWLGSCAERLRSWKAGTFRFSEDLAAIPSDLVGPLPTFSIVMAGAVVGSSEFDLMRRLGGEEARFLAASASRAPAPELLELDRHEAFFLSRLEQATSVKNLLAQADLDQMGGLQRLCRLLAVGLICREAERPDTDAAILLTSGILVKFSDRIEKSLQREPLGMSGEDHRRLIADLLARLGSMTYYELLGVPTTATSEEVHDAYTRVARFVHPSHASALGLGGREAGMQLLFERATEAYLTLIDGEKSMRYLQRVGSPGGVVEPQSTDSRRVEMARVAEENFRRAEALFAREEYHFAVELLQQAVRASPRPEYFVLLGRCQARNPKWLGRAISSFQRALEVDATNGDARLELARVLQAEGEIVRAEEEYREVLRQDPDRVEALAALARLSARRRGKGGSRQPHWFERVISRWRSDRKR